MGEAGSIGSGWNLGSLVELAGDGGHSESSVRSSETTSLEALRSAGQESLTRDSETPKEQTKCDDPTSHPEMGSAVQGLRM